VFSSHRQDGAETDLRDLGHYSASRTPRAYVTPQQRDTPARSTQAVINKENAGGDYNGGTVQVIHHITHARSEEAIHPVAADSGAY